MYLLDTDICIYLINKKPKAVLDRITKFSPRYIGISSITIAELNFGIEKSERKKINRKALETTLDPFEVYNFSKTTAIFYGKLRYNLEKRGNIIGAMDMLIAAQALELNKILVTNNEKEFRQIANLKVENWVK